MHFSAENPIPNHCIYDCAYCVNRRSNDIQRTTFTVKELVDLTIGFYRRNYIEGLFLSSGVINNPDFTMERLVRVARELRQIHRFNGYIHLKTIPGASSRLVKEAALYADRLSVNIEIPSEGNLKMLAPEKDYPSVLSPMSLIKEGIVQYKEERRIYRHTPLLPCRAKHTALSLAQPPIATDKYSRLPGTCMPRKT